MDSPSPLLFNINTLYYGLDVNSSANPAGYKITKEGLIDLLPEKRTLWLRDNPGIFKGPGTSVL